MKLGPIVYKTSENNPIIAVACHPLSCTDIVVACENKTLIHYILDDVDDKLQHEVITLDSQPISLSWQPASRSITTAGNNSDSMNRHHQIVASLPRGDDKILAIGCSDGIVRLYKGGNSTKVFVTNHGQFHAHDGVVISVRWDYEGSSIATCGEDGDIKLWSSTGHLRTKLSSVYRPVYSIAWGINSSDRGSTASGDAALVAVYGNVLSMMFPQSHGQDKNRSWKVHHSNCGVLLTVDWNIYSNLIVCGGEDKRYRIFDSQGHELFVSTPFGFSVTSVAWSPRGTMLSVGSFNNIHLCDQNGKCYSTDKVNFESSISAMQWTKDGIQFVVACMGGSLATINVFGQKTELGLYTFELIKPDEIQITDSSNISEVNVGKVHVERGPIIQFRVGFGKLIVLTRAQCIIHSSFEDFSNPVTIDVKEAVCNIILSTDKFIVVFESYIKTYSYEGRFISSPQCGGLVPFADGNVSLSNQHFACIDQIDKKMIRIYEYNSDKRIIEIGQILNESEVLSVRLNQYSSDDRTIVFIDDRQDLYIYALTSTSISSNVLDRQQQQNKGSHRYRHKLGSQVQSFTWNHHNDTLASITADGKLVVYHLPSSAFYDIDLFNATVESIDLIHLYDKVVGRAIELVSFDYSKVTLMLHDGVMVSVMTSQDPSTLFQKIECFKWQEAHKLCLKLGSGTMWAILACLAIHHRELETAEYALCELKEVAKVDQIRRIRSMPNGVRKDAEILLYRRKPHEAISILLQAQPPMIYRAIKFNIRLFRWEEAMKLVLKSHDKSLQDYLEVILWYRAQHLRMLKKKEDNPVYLKYFEDREGVITRKSLASIKKRLKDSEQAPLEITSSFS